VQSILRNGDVLIKIDESTIYDNCEVVLRGDELIQHEYLLRGKGLDEPVVFTVFRYGKYIQCEPCTLTDLPYIFQRWPQVDHQAEYLILGALVLLPCSYGLVFLNMGASTLLDGSIRQWARKWPGQ
jgi:hypothetical protein